MEFGGMAVAAAAAGEEDGMGGAGEESPAGESGYGFGSLTGEVSESNALSGGLPGDGGGSAGAPAISISITPVVVDSSGFGGGTASTPESDTSEALEMEGFGGGSLG